MIKELGKGKYQVQSSSKSFFYDIEEVDGVWKCNCKSFEFGGGRLCKHILEIRMMKRAKKLDIDREVKSY